MPSFPEVTDKSLLKILETERIVCIFFSSINCGYCQLAKKNLNDILEQIPKISVYEYIIDENSFFIEKFNITSVPLILLFENGDIVHRFFGVREKSDLYYQIKSFLAKEDSYNWPE